MTLTLVVALLMTAAAIMMFIASRRGGETAKLGWAAILFAIAAAVFWVLTFVRQS